MEIDNVCDVDDNYEDPQLCATLASDIYMHFREAEVRILFFSIFFQPAPSKCIDQNRLVVSSTLHDDMIIGLKNLLQFAHVS